MDQFCQLKNDSFRRCSCNDRVFGFQEISDNYQSVGEQLNEFNENLDTVGLTKEQATAMKTATEGEDALTEDKSASKQLLQAIMNAIKGEDSTVGGKYKNLNSLTISPDMTNAFGMNDYGQIIASYNGANLYKAVYPQCRNAVKEDCNDASLQRAVNAYLMAIEQDCNTVENALSEKHKDLKSATYESSAMLDLARVENRQNHNSDDIATCLTNVETAIQSEEVCGSGYHKCLDNGQYIDVTTGAPLTGVKDFYNLGNLLTFKTNEQIQKQKLSTLTANRDFVQFFENKTKKFAKDALDKCQDKAETVWTEYLDRALLDIYYAQQSKVKNIKQSCFNIVAGCYEDQNAAIVEAMQELTGNYNISLKPSAIELTKNMCSDYIESCNNMFAGSIIKEYLENKDKSDTELACREIAQRCFDSYGGTNYENFYYLTTGLVKPGEAIDWFTLYDETPDGNHRIVSPCAEELSNTFGCNTPEILERAFGGLDKYKYEGDNGTIYYQYTEEGYERQLRPVGIASEVYAKIIDNLSTECDQLDGFFVEAQYAKMYGYKENNFCEIDNSSTIFAEGTDNKTLHYWYNFISNENMCPIGYTGKIDVQSWGMCSCWENGNRRSKNGTSDTCQRYLPIASATDNDKVCNEDILPNTFNAKQRVSIKTGKSWCLQTVVSDNGQTCPKMHRYYENGKVYCAATENATSSITVVKDQDLHNK